MPFSEHSPTFSAPRILSGSMIVTNFVNPKGLNAHSQTTRLCRKNGFPQFCKSIFLIRVRPNR
jgi:hypothetical protein